MSRLSLRGPDHDAALPQTLHAPLGKVSANIARCRRKIIGFRRQFSRGHARAPHGAGEIFEPELSVMIPPSRDMPEATFESGNKVPS